MSNPKHHEQLKFASVLCIQKLAKVPAKRDANFGIGTPAVMPVNLHCKRSRNAAAQVPPPTQPNLTESHTL
jgi:hypothetical protein